MQPNTEKSLKNSVQRLNQLWRIMIQRMTQLLLTAERWKPVCNYLVYFVFIITEWSASKLDFAWIIILSKLCLITDFSGLIWLWW